MLRNLTALLVAILGSSPLYAAEFFCPSSNVTCLVAAINQANSTLEADTINLKAGIYTLTVVDNTSVVDGDSGLPSITSAITVRGAGAEDTVIERKASAPFSRLVHVAETGSLKLDGLTLRGGVAFFFIDIEGNERDGQGGGVLNRGALTITNSILTDNSAAGQRGSGGAIFNQGTATITTSTVAANSARTNRGGSGGAIDNGGTLTVARSALTDNFADGIVAFGGGIDNRGTLTIINSTVAGNSAIGPVFGAAGGGIDNRGTLSVINSTVAGNSVSGASPIGADGGGIFNEGIVTLQNTILARNTAGEGPDCFGPVTSLDHNLISDPTDCAVRPGPNDLTGESGIGDFADDGTPGNGHFPLLSDSQAVDRGNSEACPETDQLGVPRLGICDIGAIEFHERMLLSIDIRPRRINPRSRGRLRVTILTSELFDATTLEPNTVRFGATGTETPPLYFTLTDVDGDGDRDMILRFETQMTGIKCGDSSVSLTGETSSGLSVIGSSSIKTVGCRKKYNQKR
jgi:hypothetical protein